jgi:hypothetical protein
VPPGAKQPFRRFSFDEMFNGLKEMIRRLGPAALQPSGLKKSKRREA